MSANPFGLILVPWYNGEYERKATERATIGLSGSRLPWGDGSGFYSLNMALRYYPNGNAFKGFYLGPRVRVFWVSQEEDDIGTDEDRGPHLGLGFELGYAWLVGSERHLRHGLESNPRRWGKWRSRDVIQAEGSARKGTGVPADGAAAGAGLAPGQRWSASRKRDVVLRLLRGESLEALSREVGVEIYRLDAWRARAMAGLELGLKARHGEPVAEVLDAAKRHIGELSMEIELLRERARAAEQRLPLAMRRSRR